MIRWFVFIPSLLALNACVTERTVTDASGRVIYQDDEVRKPFESEQDKLRDVNDKERRLGLDGDVY